MCELAITMSRGASATLAVVCFALPLVFVYRDQAGR